MSLFLKKITAQEAYELGLVNEIVDPDLVMDTAKKWASEIFPNLHSSDSKNPLIGNKAVLVESDELDLEKTTEFRRILGINGFEPVFLAMLSLTEDEDELMGLAAGLGSLILENASLVNPIS